MTTKRSSSMLTGLALALLAAAISPGWAKAQNSVEGKFTLPITARWGGAILPAGDYTFTLGSAALPAIFTVRSATAGNRSAVMVMAQAYNPTHSPDKSSLTLVRRGSWGFIRSVHLAELGVDFYYAPPKQAPELLAQGPELIQRVAITTGSAVGK